MRHASRPKPREDAARRPWRRAKALVASGLAAAAFALAPAEAAPPSPETIAALCASAQGARECARRLEARQLEAYPSLARRDGDRLRVVLGPGRALDFTDSPGGADSPLYFALWDYLAPIDWAIVAVYRDDQLEYTLVDRRSGKKHVVPAEPLASVDHRHLVSVDVCRTGCSGEVAIWRVRGAELTKAQVFRAPEAWQDVTARWSGLDGITLEFRDGAATGPRSERTLSLADPAWERALE